MINDEFSEILTGDQIIEAMERVIYYRTPTANYLKSVKREMGLRINRTRVYRFPFILNSTKNWKKFVEEVLPVAYSEDAMRDIC